MVIHRWGQNHIRVVPLPGVPGRLRSAGMAIGMCSEWLTSRLTGCDRPDTYCQQMSGLTGHRHLVDSPKPIMISPKPISMFQFPREDITGKSGTR